MKFNFFRASSILRKFLVFNLIVFLVLGMFTFLYLKAIKPNLVVDRSTQHLEIIKNTTDHINRLNIQFTKESATKFLLSTRFLFQNLEYFWITHWIHPTYIHPRADLIDDEMLRVAKRHNIGVNAWTVNNKAALKWCEEMELSGIITDLEII